MALVLLEAGFELEAPPAVEPDADADISEERERKSCWSQGGGGTSSTTCSVEIRMFRDI
jgi:hypothetical protein